MKQEFQKKIKGSKAFESEKLCNDQKVMGIPGHLIQLIN